MSETNASGALATDAERAASPDAPAGADVLSGWPLDPQERGDFYHRIRAFPRDVAGWRAELVQRILTERRGRFRAVAPRSTAPEVRGRLDDGITYLREIARVLAALYSTPDLGNKKDPVDELVYIILARKTREEAYQAAFDALKQHFATWDALLNAPHATVTALVHSGGLSGKKTASLYGALGKLRDTFGTCTLEPARSWPDEHLETFLCSLPEISRKSAYCIMMYSFGRKVFPVDTHVGRVLSRLGPYRELRLVLSGLDHKKLQTVLADLVPPNLRYSLHVNLVMHGRNICRSLKPLCNRCELRNLCATYRARTVREVARRPGPTVVDLFCGAGGLSEGFRRAGYRVMLALDNDSVALRTYWLNHPEVADDRLITGDIREIEPADLHRKIGRRRVDVLVGAPPCQGFSHAGFRAKRARTEYRLLGDERNYLYEYMVEVALELEPRVVVMENVPGMQSARREDLSFLQDAAKRLRRKGGYQTAVWRLNAAAFGVPQDRIRYFLAAWHTGAAPSSPHEDYQDRQRRSFDVEALPPIMVEEAIFDLPPRQAGTGTAVDPWARVDVFANGPARRYLDRRALRQESRIVYNHFVRYHNTRDLELYELLEPGEDSVTAIERYGRGDLMRYRRDIFDDKYYKLRGDRPSKTIVAHLAKDGNSYIHPSQSRSISIRECARLQSFHDRYVFCGSPSDQWVQIGNAVPPVLGEAIARSVLSVLSSRRRDR